MKKSIYGVLTGAALVIAFAEDRPAPQDATDPASAPKISAFQKASTFLGMAVKSTDGKDLGKVSDLVFDPATARIGYAVLSLGGSAASAREVAVPVTALKPGGASNLVLNLSEPVLAASEGLAQGDWPPIDAFAVGGPAESETGEATGRSAPPTKK